MKNIYKCEYLYDMGIQRIEDYGEPVYDQFKQYLGTHKIVYTDGITSWGDDDKWLKKLLGTMDRLRREALTISNEAAQYYLY